MTTFGSVCSGIEAASVAFNPLGWRAAWLAEIEPFPCAVLEHHYPGTPNLGDMTTIAARVLAGNVVSPDVLCGGTPCQAFSVAGLRKSLDDARGNLSLKFVELANAIDYVRVRASKPASIILWENVPGVLSTKDNAFGCFLAGLAGEDEPLQPPGKRWEDAGAVYGPARAIAWRTLDAQYFGLAQRRRRVFVVASARNGFDPATVLFEWQGVRRDSAPSRGPREDAPASALCSSGGGIDREDRHSLIVGTLNANGKAAGSATQQDAGSGMLLTFGGNQTSGPHSVSSALSAHGGSGRMDFESETFIVCARAIAFDCKASGQNGFGIGEIASTQRAMGHKDTHQNGGGHQAALTQSGVRRLTPRECERLQGFPDDYTAVPVRGKPAADGPRYKALGNSWAVPCARWVGQRINRALRAST